MGTAMKPLLLVGLSAAALAGCATPEYPVTQGYTPPPPITPKYPITKASAETSAPPAQLETVSTSAADTSAQTDNPPTLTAPTPAPVQSTPLAPVAGAPASTPTSALPASTPTSAPPPSSTPAPPPSSTSAPPPSPTPAPPPSAPAVVWSVAPAPPPQAYEPPRPTRRAEVRTVTGGKVVTAHGMYRDYAVQDGDHLDAIARDLNTTRDELIDANHLRSPYRIHPGQHIKVPVAKAYVVEGGDTMSAIARRFGVSLGEISSLNDLPERGRLTPGMFVALPTHYDDHGPSKETEEVYTAPKPEPQRPSYAQTRPHATYSTEPQTTYAPGPYTPSPEALAAAAARREQQAHPTPTYQSSQSYEAPRAETPATAAELTSLGQGKFIWPVKGQVISPFGASGMGRRNDGVDIGAVDGSEVRAAAVGEVVYAGDQVPGFGNLVLIKHSGGWVSAYAHLGSVSVHMRETVYQGQQIGTVGETGGVSQPQLHFELRYAANTEEKAKPLDPLLVLPK